MKLRELLNTGAHELTKTFARFRQRKYTCPDPCTYLRKLCIRLLSGANALKRRRDGFLVFLYGLSLQLDDRILR